MKYLKIVLGVLLIIAAVCAMYYWTNNAAEAEKSLENAKTEIAENIVPKELTMFERAYQKNLSFFPIPAEWIYAKSNLLKVGDNISIYFRETLKKFGSFEVAFVGDGYVDIICKLDDFIYLDDYFNKNDNQPADLIFVMEKNNG